LSDPDSDLMLRVRDGEGGAFEALVERFLRPLVRFFHRMGADLSLAEDCAQEVFLKLYRTRSGYEPRAKFSTFLFRVARNHWIDVYRHRAAAPPSVSAEGSGDDADDSDPPRDRLPARPDPPADAAEGRELLVALREAVLRLPAEHREVLALTRGGTLRYEEVAAILEIPVGTVKSRMHAAVGALRDLLRRGGHEP
jgi:RNA polymerase sigma-70 factor (ECF subfamily)